MRAQLLCHVLMMVDTSLVFEFAQPEMGLVYGGGGINGLEVSSHYLAQLPAHVVQAVARHVRDARLNWGLGPQWHRGSLSRRPHGQ